MTSAPLDLSRTDRPRQIQENMIAYMRLFAGFPGVTVSDTAETFWIATREGEPGRAILRTRWQADEAEQQIDALFAQIGQHTDTIDWMIFPGDQPADLGARLAARGMPGGPAGNWLWADLRTLGEPPAVPDNFRIEPVRDNAALAVWVEVSAAGFGAAIPYFYEAYARHGYGSAAFSLHYIGYLDDTPVTSGTLLDAGGCAAIYDVSTPPAFRRQGFGSAITHALMGEIRQRGYAETWIWSSDMAQSVYQSLGYIAADFGVREHTWHKA